MVTSETNVAVSSRSTESGFTVIEALVAMAILAVAALGLIGVSEAQVERVDGLETRAIALWVAENDLTELQLSGPGKSDAPGTTEMLDREWTISREFADTSDPDLKRVTITVTESGSAGAAQVLSGFVDGRLISP